MAFLYPKAYPETGGFLQPLSIDKETKYFERMQAGDKSACEQLVKHNMRLVAHVAKRYQGPDQDELISIGSVGLLKAVNTFRVGVGTRFSTYAAKCIENEILMYLRANKHERNNVSLYQAVGMDKDGNEVALIDTLAATEDEVAAKIETEERNESLYRAIEAVLDDREKRIVTYRYGLYGADRLSQRQIALTEGISRSYISRIEKKALAKLQAYLEDNGMI